MNAFFPWREKAWYIIRASRAWGRGQVVEFLSNKCKALSSNPSTTKRKQQKKKEGSMNIYGEVCRGEVY
jgi:ribosomal protein S3AE